MASSFLGANSGGLSGDAWQALSQIVGQAIMAASALGGIVLTARYSNKRRHRKSEVESTEVDTEESEAVSLRSRVRSLTNEVAFLEEQLTFTRRQLTFERRRNQILEQEIDSAWQTIHNLQAEQQRRDDAHGGNG